MGKLIAALKPAREGAGLSQDELATRLGWVGTRGGAHVGRVERGERSTSLDTIELWLEATGCDVYVVPQSAPDMDAAAAVVAGAGEELPLLLRLARILPRLDNAARDRLAADIDYLERRYTGA